MLPGSFLSVLDHLIWCARCILVPNDNGFDTSVRTGAIFYVLPLFLPLELFLIIVDGTLFMPNLILKRLFFENIYFHQKITKIEDFEVDHSRKNY